MKSSGSVVLILSLVVSVLSGCASKRQMMDAASSAAPSVVFLVRHAEKVDSSRDPELSEVGKVRAKTLADVLRSADIDYIHSSDYIRTRDTARPLALVTGLEIALYDPGDLPTIAETVKTTPGRHLVVGHSNTTPQLAALLGGESGPEINEANEYDRLYILTIGKNGAVSSVIMRYGVKYQP